KHANITLEKRNSDANKEKIWINNSKYVSEGNDIGVGNQVLTGFSNTNREKIILRRINQLHLDNIEIRRLNDRVMAQTGMLEKPPFSDRINGRSLTGYLGMVKLESGYIGQVYEDYRDWLSLTTVGEILKQVGNSSSAEKRQRAQNIVALLVSDQKKLEDKFGTVDVPPGTLMVDDSGYL